MTSTIINLWPIIVFFALGYAAARAGIAKADLPHQLNQFAIRFVFPAVIFLSVPRLEITGGVYFAILSPWLCILISWAAVMLLSRILGWSRDIEGALLVLTALGNTGFLGVPMIKALFGIEHVALAVVYDQLGTFIAVTTYATILVAIYSGDQRVSAPHILKKVLLFPPFVSLIIALLLPDQALQPIEPLLEILALAVIPITMLSVGMQFDFKVEHQYIRPLAAGLLIKMLLMPLAIALLGYLLSVPEIIWQTSIFQSAAPPMVTGAVLLTANKIAPKFTASMLGFGTILALAWLPLIYLILSA